VGGHMGESSTEMGGVDCDTGIASPTTGLLIQSHLKCRGGSPDIIAWREGSIASAVFVESKMVKEAIRPDQEKWFREAKNAGVSHNQCAIARWRKSKA
jgi:VRR-NUC domain